MSSPFELLLEDLAAVQAQRRPPSRDAVSRATTPRPLRKSEPVPYRAPDWDGLAARQERIAAGMEQSRVLAQQDAIRAHLATLAAAAKAGKLSSFEAAKYDALVGQALRMGLQP